MKIKILFLFFVLMIGFTPITVFADSLYYEVMDDFEDLAIVEIDNNMNFVCKDEYGEDRTSTQGHLTKKKQNEIMDYFKSHIREEDRTDYVPERTLRDYKTEEGYYLTEGYILRICENNECKEYFSETPIISENEIAFNEMIREVGKSEDIKFLIPFLLSIALILLMPIILVTIIIVLVIVLNKKKRTAQKIENDW